MLLTKFLSIYVCFEMFSSRCPAQGVPGTDGKFVNANVKRIFGFLYLSGEYCPFAIPGARRLSQPSLEKLDPLASGLTETKGFLI